MLLAAPEYFDSYEAIGLISTAVTLYALYLVLVVILGRTGRTEFNFPAAIGALVANVALNLVLVPPLGIVRRRPCPRRLLPGGAGADVRLHPAPLPGSLRVGEAAPRGSDRGGHRRRRPNCWSRPRERSASSCAPPSSRPTRSPSSPPASSVTRSAAGSRTCATRAPCSQAWPPSPRSTAALPRSTRSSAWTRTPGTDGSGQAPARSRIDSPRSGKSAWRAWAQKIFAGRLGRTVAASARSA